MIWNIPFVFRLISNELFHFLSNLHNFETHFLNAIVASFPNKNSQTFFTAQTNKKMSFFNGHSLICPN